MMLWPLFFIGLLRADDVSVEKYCFNSPVQMERAHSQFRAIAVRADRVEKDGTCLVISAPSHRRELIQKYLLSNHPDMSISFSSAEIRSDPCDLKIEKVMQSTVKDLDVELGKTGIIEARDQQASGLDTFHITTIKDFELSIDQDKILGECRYITPQRYEITLTVKKESRPLIPPVPAGTVIVVTAPPPDQETSVLKIQLQLQRGSRIEIGSVIRDLKNKSSEASIEPHGRMKDDVRKWEVKTFLSIH